MAVKEYVKDQTKSRMKLPRPYQVLIYNDDFTPMEFVVEILINIFRKDLLEAERLMMTVHESGRASVGAYTYDIAVTKVHAASELARQEGFPFRMTVEEA